MEGDAFEFCQSRIVDLTDTAFVDAEFSWHIVLASVKIVKEGHHVVLALGKAFPGILDIGPVHKGRQSRSWSTIPISREREDIRG